jgi:hypothetical protein
MRGEVEGAAATGAEERVTAHAPELRTRANGAGSERGGLEELRRWRYEIFKRKRSGAPAIERRKRRAKRREYIVRDF